MELNEKDRIFKDLKSKFDELTEKMVRSDWSRLDDDSFCWSFQELTEEEINQVNKENEELRAQYHALFQETVGLRMCNAFG